MNKRTFISSVSGKCILFEQEIHCRKSAVELLHFSRLSPRLKSQFGIFQKGRRILGDIAKEMRLILHSDAEPFKQVTALEQRENQAAKRAENRKQTGT